MEKSVTIEAVDYICKLADGGMRDCLTMLDKCLSYKNEVSLEDVLEVLGTSSYWTFFALMEAILSKDPEAALRYVAEQHNLGKDLKQFMRNFQFFLLDVAQYKVFGTFDHINIPNIDHWDDLMDSEDLQDVLRLLKWAQGVNNAIKWDPNPRGVVCTAVMLESALEGE